MGALEEASAVLRAAEQNLRSILVKAAERGDYDDLPQIAEWAKLLNSTLGGHGSSAELAPIKYHPPEPALSGNGIHERLVEARSKATPSGSNRGKAGRRKKQRRSRTTKSEYPKFLREGDSLVKIGWSKSESKPYEHKAPRAVLRALVQSLTRAGGKGERFTMEGIFPLKNISDSSEIPDYQAYLTLAWLRSVGLIVQHGRQGYSLPKGMDLERESERHWNDLKPR
jgi:hypothetical protein